MAQYRFSASIVSRGGGSSIIAKAAYNAREAIRDERTGELKDYSRKSGLEFSGIFAPNNAPEWVKDRAQLWNAVERREDRSNRPDDAQLARDLEVNFPHELNAEQRKQLVRDFVREQIVRKGIIADVTIHAPDRDSDERNYHAHILLTLREIGPDGFGKKARDWNSKALNSQWREKWAELGARYLENAGHKLEAERYRVAHLTLQQQREAALKRGDREHAEALDREPTKHLGPHVAAMERKGVETDLGNAHRDILQRNDDRATLRALKRELAALERQDRQEALGKLKHELREADKLLAGKQREAERGNTGRAAGKEPRREAEREPAARPVPTRGPAAEIRHAYQQSDSPRAFAAALEDKHMALAVVTKEEAARSHRQASFAKEIGNQAPRYREGEIVVVREAGPVYRQNGKPTEPSRVYPLNEYTTGHDRAAVEKFLAPLPKTQLRGIEATKRTLDDRAQKRRREIAAARLKAATGTNASARTREKAIKAPRILARTTGTVGGGLLKAATRLIDGLFELGGPSGPPKTAAQIDKETKDRERVADAAESDAAAIQRHQALLDRHGQVQAKQQEETRIREQQEAEYRYRQRDRGEREP